ncbi:carbohydrate porin, partial [Enterobacter cloacae]|nr:carbohydrate porin [Enterobacter cloacae]
MANKNKFYAFALLTLSPLSMAQDWNGTVLGFEAPPAPVLGEMLGVRKILNDNGFTYNLGYLNEIGWNGSGANSHGS